MDTIETIETKRISQLTLRDIDRMVKEICDRFAFHPPHSEVVVLASWLSIRVETANDDREKYPSIRILNDGSIVVLPLSSDSRASLRVMTAKAIAISVFMEKGFLPKIRNVEFGPKNTPKDLIHACDLFASVLLIPEHLFRGYKVMGKGESFLTLAFNTTRELVQLRDSQLV